MRIVLAPGLKAAVHAVNLGEVFLDKKLRCALTAVAVIAIDNQSLVGIGGLGHLAVKLAVAKGAEVVAFTTSPSKVADIESWGAKAVVVDGPEALGPHRATLDWVISTIPVKYDVAAYASVAADPAADPAAERDDEPAADPEPDPPKGELFFSTVVACRPCPPRSARFVMGERSDFAAINARLSAPAASCPRPGLPVRRVRGGF